MRAATQLFSIALLGYGDQDVPQQRSIQKLCRMDHRQHAMRASARADVGCFVTDPGMRIFTEFDRDMDGAINSDELTEACAKYISMVNAL